MDALNSRTISCDFLALRGELEVTLSNEEEHHGASVRQLSLRLITYSTCTLSVSRAICPQIDHVSQLFSLCSPVYLQ